MTDGCGKDFLIDRFAPFLFGLRALDRFEPFERDLADRYRALEISLLSLKYIIRPFLALLARSTIKSVYPNPLYKLIPNTNHIYTPIQYLRIMSDDLLTGYRKVSSFALWDGEEADLRFTGEVNPNFKKVDSKGIEHTYLGIDVHLIKHSNENYAHQEGTDTVFRVGLESTIAKWIEDGGIKKTPFLKRTIFTVDMRKSSGYGLSIRETKEK